MGYELDKLMSSLGVSSASLLPYAGEEDKPARPGANATAEEISAYNDKMAKYVADKDAYRQYANQYRERVSSGSPYTQAQYQPTRTTPAPETIAQQAPTRTVPWDETPVTLGARPPVNYVRSTAPTWDTQITAPKYGRLPEPSGGLAATTEMAGAAGSSPYYIAIQRYLENHTPEEAKTYFNASDFDISRARQFVAPTNEWNPSFVGPHVDLPNNVEDALFRDGNRPDTSTNAGPSTTPFGTLPSSQQNLPPSLRAISIEQARNALVQSGVAYGNMPGATIRGPQQMADFLGVPVTRGGNTFTPTTPSAETSGQTPATPPSIPSGPLTIEQARSFLTERNIPFGNQEGAVVRGPQAMADYFRTPIVRGGRTFLPGQAHRIEPPGTYGPLAGRGGAPAAVVAANRPRPVTPGMPAGPLTTVAAQSPATPAGPVNPFNLSPDIIANIRRMTGQRFAHGGPVHMQGGGFMDNQYIMAPRDEEPGNEASLRDMLEAYQSAMGPSSYAEDIKAAREKASAQQEELLKSLQGAAGGDDSSKAEMYFRLAAALGQPTRTGTFGETIGNVGQAMAESAKAGRERQMAQRQLALEAQKIRAAGAKEDLNTLVEQAKEESSGRRLLAGELLKSKLAEPSEEKKFEIQARLADIQERRAAAAEQSSQAALQQAAAAERRAAAMEGKPEPIKTINVLDPMDASSIWTVDANTYVPGSPMIDPKTKQPSPGVIGKTGKEPTAAAKQDAMLQGADLFDTTTSLIKDKLDFLKKNKSITSKDFTKPENYAISARLSGVGQQIARAGGSETQSAADVLGSSRLQLLNAFKQATGMNQKQIDSNAELKTWLSSLGDIHMSYEAQNEILSNLVNFANKRRERATKESAMTPSTGAPTSSSEMSDEDLLNFHLGQ